mmetsp:Transcript_56763/g.105058  ORF Transcript_56763/g.105058 Transcript_56763/m.105058 type:complete len:370 (+) Transcript_56763:108-1217(+)
MELRWLRWLLVFLIVVRAQHYTNACAGDEVSGEIMGQTGVICAPHCRDGSLDCPADVPVGASARPQCILQDVDGSSYCGLVCSYDSDCGGSAYCHQLVAEDGSSLGICMSQVTFADWAKSTLRRKLKVAPRSPVAAGALANPNSLAAANPSTGYQVTKAYGALQNLKRRFNIQDGDQDVLSMKELLSAVSAQSGSTQGAGSMLAVSASLPPSPAPPPVLAAPAPPAPSGYRTGTLDKWEHDLGYLAKNMQRGLVPGIEKELQDTVWNVEHIHRHGASSTLLRGIIWCAVLYLAIGVTYKHQVLGARGLDMVPHIGFWIEYPALVADGVRYAAMAVGDIIGSGSVESRTRGFQPMSGSARDTFTYFEPSK